MPGGHGWAFGHRFPDLLAASQRHTVAVKYSIRCKEIHHCLEVAVIYVIGESVTELEALQLDCNPFSGFHSLTLPWLTRRVQVRRLLMRQMPGACSVHMHRRAVAGHNFRGIH